MPRPPRPAIERFLKKVDKTDDGCWLWTGATTAAGYGCFKARSYTLVLAHRWSYEFYLGPIPEGLTIDHLCRDIACVNPAHLEPVTGAINNHRRPEHTTCPAGHPFDEANTYIEVRPHPTSLRPGKHCRTCDRARKREARARGRHTTAVSV